MREVRPKLFIGGKRDATDIQLLADSRISHILTLDRVPLLLPEGVNVSKMFVQADDDVDFDLISHFTECFEFIAEALDKGSGILVHCLAGRSRSVTVVLAYLMKTENLKYDNAFSSLRSIHPYICPNDGFVKQLQLFEAMSFTVDKNNGHHKLFKLAQVAKEIRAGAELRQVFAKNQLITEIDSDKDVTYRCRKCRYRLFGGGNILPHTPSHGTQRFNSKGYNSAATATEETTTPQCTSIFTEPLEWLLPSLEGVIHGKIHCPKCAAKLGSFDWAGCQCCCSAWITPSFQFHKSHIDIILIK